MTKFPVGTRVLNTRTGELATVVERPYIGPYARIPDTTWAEVDSTPTEYDNDPGTVWYTSNSKLEVVR